MNTWLLVLGVIALATTAVGVRLKNRRRGGDGISTDPVSGEWLAEARGREDHSW
jgi:hypothetical protein